MLIVILSHNTTAVQKLIRSKDLYNDFMNKVDKATDVCTDDPAGAFIKSHHNQIKDSFRYKSHNLIL